MAKREFTWKLRETGTKKNVIGAAEKAEKAEKTKCAERQGRVGWGRKERKEDECRQSKKCRRKSACARRPAKKMQCERKEGRESGVSRNAARVWRTKAKREGNRVRNGEMEKQ